MAGVASLGRLRREVGWVGKGEWAGGEGRKGGRRREVGYVNMGGEEKGGGGSRNMA